VVVADSRLVRPVGQAVHLALGVVVELDLADAELIGPAAAGVLGDLRDGPGGQQVTTEVVSQVEQRPERRGVNRPSHAPHSQRASCDVEASSSTSADLPTPASPAIGTSRPSPPLASPAYAARAAKRQLAFQQPHLSGVRWLLAICHHLAVQVRALIAAVAAAAAPVTCPV
jgi:hypothetical protein